MSCWIDDGIHRHSEDDLDARTVALDPVDIVLWTGVDRHTVEVWPRRALIGTGLPGSARHRRRRGAVVGAGRAGRAGHGGSGRHLAERHAESQQPAHQRRRHPTTTHSSWGVTAWQWIPKIMGHRNLPQRRERHGGPPVVYHRARVNRCQASRRMGIRCCRDSAPCVRIHDMWTAEDPVLRVGKGHRRPSHRHRRSSLG